MLMVLLSVSDLFCVSPQRIFNCLLAKLEKIAARYCPEGITSPAMALS